MYFFLNSSWDEWVPESRIMKYNDANLAKQNELKASQESNKGKRNSRSGRNSKAGKDKPGDAKSEGSVHDSDSRFVYYPWGYSFADS